MCIYYVVIAANSPGTSVPLPPAERGNSESKYGVTEVTGKR